MLVTTTSEILTFRILFRSMLVTTPSEGLKRFGSCRKEFGGVSGYSIPIGMVMVCLLQCTRHAIYVIDDTIFALTWCLKASAARTVAPLLHLPQQEVYHI